MKFSECMDLLKKDLARNKRNTKGKLIMTLFRTSGYMYSKRKNRLIFIPALPLILFYKIFVEYFLSVGLPLGVSADGGLVIFHGQGLVVHDNTKIGANVTLRHNTTIGCKSLGDDGKAPVLRDHVNVGANSVILGDIVLGEGSIVAAGSVVLKGVPAGAVVAGNPARIIRGEVPESRKDDE
jgi:putative colanic acid biosynthesis acetyltransferase WcaB